MRQIIAAVASRISEAMPPLKVQNLQHEDIERKQMLFIQMGSLRIDPVSRNIETLSRLAGGNFEQDKRRV